MDETHPPEIQRSVGRRKEDLDLRRRIEKHNQLFQVGQTVTSETDIDRLFDIIMEQTNDIIGAERSTVFLHDPDAGRLWSLSATGLQPKMITVRTDHGIAGSVFREQEALIINDPYNDPRFYSEVDRKTGFRTRNILTIPIINREGVCIGVLQALNKIDGDFDANDLDLITSISHYVAIALENSKLIDELKQKKKALEKELQVRADFSHIFISIVLMISLYSFFTAILMQFHVRPAAEDIISHVLEGLFIIASIVIVVRSRLPLSYFGLSFQRVRRPVVESLIVTGAVMAGLVGLKWTLAWKGTLFVGEPLVSFHHLDWTYVTYLLIAPLQEFITRGVFQGTIQRLMVGRLRWLWAVILTSFLFGMFHIHESIVLGMVSISFSTMWGLMYVRHRNIIGISLSHFLIGNWAGVTGFWSLLMAA